MRQQIFDPTVRFSCQSCTACCDQPWQTLIEADKAAVLAKHDFSRYPQIAGQTLFYPKEDGTTVQLVLAKGEGCRCLFLDRDGLCIVHKELGASAKPNMCQQFPFLPNRTWTEDRVSCNYGCPAVQTQSGTRLIEQAADIATVAPVSQRPTKEDARIPLSPTTTLSRREADAVFQRAMAIFDETSKTDIWSCFAELLSLLVTVQNRLSEKSDDSTSLEAWLGSSSTPFANTFPEVTSYSSPTQAPLGARFLFAATLYPDTLPSDASVNMGFLRRLTLVPRLMALARLSGTYASRLLGRSVSVGTVLSTPVEETLAPEATGLLKRYYRSRLWQNFPAGTRLPMISGVHQHILDLNAVLFYARVEALESRRGALDEKLIAQALTRVEFHLANQTRLYEHTLKAWLRTQLQEPLAAFASLRLLASRPVVAAVGQPS